MSIAPGEPGGMPLEIATELYGIGAQIETQRTGEIYAALHAGASFNGLSITRDVAYGPHERHVLDVVRSMITVGARPVVVFVHGGGFRLGQKSAPDLFYYDNVMRWVAANDMVGVNINYRLGPEFQWPSGIEDLSRVINWLQQNIVDYGGDPEEVFFWGHSAGAAHVGDYLADRTGKGESHGIAGAILTSGFYELGSEVSIWNAYYGDDVSTYPERSALERLAAADLPLFINDAELDAETFQPESRKLVDARRAAGTPVEYLHLPAHSHISELYAVGTDDKSLSDPVLSFIRNQLSQ